MKDMTKDPIAMEAIETLQNMGYTPREVVTAMKRLEEHKEYERVSKADMKSARKRA